jgi:site-specific DNA-cytosine methylase
VADPRSLEYSPGYLGVTEWEKPAHAVSGRSTPTNGYFTVADPRTGYKDAHKNVYRIVRWDEASQTISAGHGPSSGGMSVADPRFPNAQGEHSGKYSVQKWDEASSTITGSDRIGSGALCIADPRPDWDARRGNNLIVESWDDPSRTIIGGGKGVQGGWLSVADPRPTAQRDKGDAYLTNGNYGVVPWDGTSGAVSAAANHDNGRWNVADPRLPEAQQKIVAIIRALDGTWHRPFTTLELAALQSLVDPENLFDLDGNSDSAKRERIGNAVPPQAAQAIADLMGQTLLLVWSGQTFALSATPIWVQPVAIALSVKPWSKPE